MPNEAKTRRHRPPRKTFGNHCFTVLELYVRCEFKKKPISSFLVAYSKEPNEPQWREEARTEICENTRYPNYRQWNYRIPGYDWTESMKFDFSLESLRLVRVEAYKTRDLDDIINLSAQSYLGCAEVELSQLFLLQGVGDGHVTMPLQNPLKEDEELGSIVFLCREEFHSKQLANLTIKGTSVSKGTFWKLAADPYYIINRTKESSGKSADGRRLARVTELRLDTPGPTREPIIRSEVGKRTSAPQWEKITVPVPVLCHTRKGLLIEIEVYDWMRVEEDQLVGRASFTYEDMEQAFRESRPINLTMGMSSRGGCCCSCPFRRRKDKTLQHRLEDAGSEQLGAHTAMIGKKPSKGYQPLTGKNTGSLSLEVQLGRYFSFYDYIRGGLELKLVVGIDFTRSNEGPASLSSLHRWGGNGPNDYISTLRMVGEVVQKYDLEKKHVAYGFGAKLPPSYPASISSCFALTGDFFSPCVDRVDGLIDAYQRALRVVFLHGPSRMKDVVRIAIDWAMPSKDVHQVNDNNVDMRYWVSLILTDGDIVDKQECMHEILEASNLPISFLIVGIGDADFDWFEQLNDNVQQSQKAANKKIRDSVTERKLVHFVRFNEFRGKPPHEFVEALMADLPGVAITYYKCLGIKPWNLPKYESPSGALLPVPHVDRTYEDALKAKKRGPAGKAKAAVVDKSSELMRKRQPTKDAAGPALPNFLNECRDKLISEALDYGYSKVLIEKVLKDGIPDGKIEVLLDTLLHGGYGKRPIFKSMAEEINFEKLALADAKKSKLHQAALADIRAPAGPPAVLPNVLRGTTYTRSLGDATENLNNDPARSLSNLKGSASPSSGMSENFIDLPGAVESQMVLDVCKICRFKSIDTEFVPCGHRVACRECAEQSFEANGHVCSYCGKSVTEALQFVGDQLV